MIGAMWICLFMVTVGLVLYIGELVWRKRGGGDIMHAKVGDIKKEEGANQEDGEKKKEEVRDEGGCCGLHLVCEKDSLSPVGADVEYYDDEELDRFLGREADSYTPGETEEFRDVLMTLRPEDIAGWARSITMRGLELPLEVREELLMLVNEQRMLKRD